MAGRASQSQDTGKIEAAVLAHTTNTPVRGPGGTEAELEPRPEWCAPGVT